jgi:hypothetical protein
MDNYIEHWFHRIFKTWSDLLRILTRFLKI